MMKRIIPYLLVLFILAWMTMRFDLYTIFSRIQGIPVALFLLLCGLQLVTLLLINFQWHTIAGYLNADISYWGIFHIQLSGTFVECITPSVKAGGEAAKIWLFRSKGVSTPDAAAIVLLQKSISLFAFLMLNTAAVLWFFCTVKVAGPQKTLLLGGLCFLALVFGLLLLCTIHPKALYLFARCLPKKGPLRGKLTGAVESLNSSLKMIRRDRRQLAGQLCLSILIWGLFALKAYLITSSMEMNLGFIPVAVVTYLTYMAGMVPLLPGGLGTFEATMVFLLKPLGIEYDQGIAAAILLRFITFWMVFLISAAYVGGSSFSRIFKITLRPAS